MYLPCNKLHWSHGPPPSIPPCWAREGCWVKFQNSTKLSSELWGTPTYYSCSSLLAYYTLYYRDSILYYTPTSWYCTLETLRFSSLYYTWWCILKVVITWVMLRQVLLQSASANCFTLNVLSTKCYFNKSV